MNRALHEFETAMLYETEFARESPEFRERIAFLLSLYRTECELDVFARAEDLQVITDEINRQLPGDELVNHMEECLPVIVHHKKIKTLFPLTVSLLAHDLLEMTSECYQLRSDILRPLKRLLDTSSLDGTKFHRLCDPFKGLIRTVKRFRSEKTVKCRVLNGYARVATSFLGVERVTVTTGSSSLAASKLCPAICGPQGGHIWSHRVLGRALVTPLMWAWRKSPLPASSCTIEYVELALSARLLNADDGEAPPAGEAEEAAREWLQRYSTVTSLLSGVCTAFRDYSSLALREPTAGGELLGLLSGFLTPTGATDQFGGFLFGLGLLGLLRGFPTMFTVSLVGSPHPVTSACGLLASALNLVGVGCNVWCHVPTAQGGSVCVCGDPRQAQGPADDCRPNAECQEAPIHLRSPQGGQSKAGNPANPDGLPADTMFAARHLSVTGRGLVRILRFNIKGGTSTHRRGPASEAARAVSPLALGLVCACTCDPSLTALVLNGMRGGSPAVGEASLGRTFVLNCGISVGLINLVRCTGCSLRPAQSILESLVGLLSYEGAPANVCVSAALLAVCVIVGGLRARLTDAPAAAGPPGLTGLIRGVEVEISIRLPLFNFVDRLIGMIVCHVDCLPDLEAWRGGLADGDRQVESAVRLAAWSLCLGLSRVSGGQARAPGDEMPCLFAHFEEITVELQVSVRGAVPLDYGTRKRRLELAVCHDLFLLGVSLCVCFGDEPGTGPGDCPRTRLTRVLSRHCQESLDYHFGRSFIVSLATAMVGFRLSPGTLSANDRSLLRALLLVSVLPPPPVSPPRDEEAVGVLRHALLLVLGRLLRPADGDPPRWAPGILVSRRADLLGHVTGSAKTTKDLVELMDLLTAQP